MTAGGLVLSLPGAEARGPRGSFWRFTRRLPFGGAFPGPLGRHRGEDAALEAMARAGWDTVVFVDLETCGFAGTPLFLAGLLGWDGEALVLTQLLARTYAEEAAVVEATVAALRDRPVVSFNGKSYDIPFLRERAGRHGTAPPQPGPHLDLLHAARRRWRRRLPDCRLVTLEAALRGRPRTADVPGREVPERYHAFVRTGEPRLLIPVLRHNREDLLTLVAILGRLDQESPGNCPAHDTLYVDRSVLGLTTFFA